MLSVTVLSVIMLSAIMLNLIMLSAFILSVIVLSVLMLNVIMMNVIMLNVISKLEKNFFIGQKWALMQWKKFLFPSAFESDSQYSFNMAYNYISPNNRALKLLGWDQFKIN